jgi:outer membrane immunogenic protein
VCFGAVMKKLATAITAIALIGTPAFAADMAVKAPPPPAAAPVPTWTGFYVGGNIGASFGNVKADFGTAATVFDTPANFPTASFPTSFAGRDEVYPGGFIGGGQIGFNWQFSSLWVVGLEADFQGADEKEHSTLTSNFSGPLFGNGFSSFVEGLRSSITRQK